MSIVAVHGPTMLGAGGDSGTGGPAGDADPSISGISPSTLPASAGPTLITITGNDFEATSVIEVGAVVHPTTFVSSTTLTTTYDPLTPGTVNVTVRNVNDEESNNFPFV